MFGGERYMYYLNSNTIYNPERLNISKTIDLIEKLKPLFLYIWSCEMEDNKPISDSYICVKAFYPYLKRGDCLTLNNDCACEDRYIRVRELFKIKIEEITNEKEIIFQKIYTEIKKDYYHHTFYNQPFQIRIYRNILREYNEEENEEEREEESEEEENNIEYWTEEDIEEARRRENEEEVSPLSPPLLSRLLNKEEKEKIVNVKQTFKFEECVSVSVNKSLALSPYFCLI